MTELQKKQILNMRKEGAGYKSIAVATGLSRDAVRNFCKSRNMAGFGKAAEMNADERLQSGELCLNCYEKLYQPASGRRRKFCSDKCRRDWWKNHQGDINRNENAIYHYKCAYCGKEFTAYGNNKRKYCSHYCYIHDRFWRKEKRRE